MKEINKNIRSVVFLVVIFLSGCSLNQEPTSFFSDSNFFQTPEEVNVAVLSAYQTMTVLDYLRPYMNIPTTASEEAFPKEGEGLNIDQLEAWTVDDRNENLLQFFRLSYIGLNRANKVIEVTETADFNEVFINKFRGESLFLRAWHHFMLVRLFGDVPLRLNAVDELSEVRGLTNSSIEQVYASIMDDLTEATQLLTIDRDGGRADLVAAQSLLAKVYITLASSKATGSPGYEWVPDADTYYGLASDMAGLVVNGQTEYQFDTDLLNVYDVSDDDSFNGPEHIFFIPQNRNGQKEGEFSKLASFFIPADIPTTSFLPDGLGINVGFGVYVTESQFLATYEASDRRRSELIVEELFDKDGNRVWTPAGGESQPFSRKYTDPLFIGDNTSTHPYLIRFTDVLLIYAEAQGPTTEGYEAVNRVRTRAGLADLAAGLSTEVFRNAVIRERSFELAFEGHRLYDLRRTNAIESVLQGQYGKSISSGAYFYPIPAVEGELNGQ
ncbi:MAG: RagB/SusD family nutrient uptake outer membrane protein [Bacteroidota bacterium]